MSRSIHKTLKGVFGGQGKAAIEELITTNDSDVMELVQKARFKDEERRFRAAENAPPASNDVLLGSEED